MNKKNKRINCVKDLEKFLVNENIYNDEILTEGAIGPYIGRVINAGKSKLPALASKYASARNALIHAAQHPIETLKKSPDFIADRFSRLEMDPVRGKKLTDIIKKYEDIIVSSNAKLDKRLNDILYNYSAQPSGGKPIALIKDEFIDALRTLQRKIDKTLPNSPERNTLVKQKDIIVSRIQNLDDIIDDITNRFTRIKTLGTASNASNLTAEEIAIIRDIENARRRLDVYTNMSPLVRKQRVGPGLWNFVKNHFATINKHPKVQEINDEIIGYTQILSTGLENNKPISQFRRAQIIDLINKKKDSLQKFGVGSDTPGLEPSLGKFLKSSAAWGTVLGLGAAGAEKNEDISAIKKGLNPWSFGRGFPGTISDTIGKLWWIAWSPMMGVKKITEKTLNTLNIVKTPDEFPKLFEQLSNAPKEVRDKIVPKLSWNIRSKYFIYEKSKRAKNLVTNVTNMPTAAKVGLGAAGLAGGALAANEIRKQIALNQAKVYGCDTIEDPDKKLKCEIMVAKENIKEYKKFLSKCYDSNNPESCVKIYSQKVKDEEAKLANLTNQFNSQNKPKSIATIQPSENKPKKSKKTKSKSKPKKSEEPKRLN